MTRSRPAGDIALMHRTGRRSSYDKAPVVAVGDRMECAVGWAEIAGRLTSGGPSTIVVETYPGVREEDLDALVAELGANLVIRAESALRPSAAIDQLIAADLTDDPVFGRLSSLTLLDLFDPSALADLRASARVGQGRVVVVGVGASFIVDDADDAGAQEGTTVVVYADLPRRELTLRQQSGAIGNLGADNAGERASVKYKRAFFVDWRLADRHKQALWPSVRFVLDTVHADQPKMVAAAAMFRGLELTTTRPFRVVPWFEPAPWGGDWMKEVCDLPRDTVNFGWCFDCVPEENSLLLGFGDAVFEVPSANLVFHCPVDLLGADVADRFEGEFPIRFDFLDTMGGGNLSLQVHPLTSYIREHFGLTFTQDESYYMLDADEGAAVYLGLRTGIDRHAMVQDLRSAQEGGPAFDTDSYVNKWPAARHDHFLIPAGTVHCSGAGAMVLEISATPYIFTFKLWDWDRLGLDGRPRPVHLDHGASNIQWQRDTDYAIAKLINRLTPIGEGEGWRAERTGLHEAEFIDTHRHWFTGIVDHDTSGGVNVLNLVQGDEVVIESPDGAFAPFVVHYAETFIVPAAVGRYTIRPHGSAEGTECATIKAFVRSAE